MTSPLAGFRHALASAVAERIGLSAEWTEKLEAQIRRPDAGRGDLALPCFALAHARGQKPPDAAQSVAAALREDPQWASVEPVGPYVNVTYATTWLAEAVVPAARARGYGTSDAGAGRTVVIDFSSPNIAKPLAFHHIRSAVIGAAISNLHRAQGWKVVGINYLGDWGKQFGLLATGFARHGDPARRADAKHLVEVYVKANREADVAGVRAAIEAPDHARAITEALRAAREARRTAPDAKTKKKAEKSAKSLEKKLRSQRPLEPGDPLEGAEGWIRSLEHSAAAAKARLADVEAKDGEARAFLRRMESKDPEALATWQAFRRTSIEEFERTYALMGVEFTALEGESTYQDVLEQTVARVREKPGTRIDDGAEVVDMLSEKGEPPAIVKTRDGTTLYLTRDIAAARDRFERFRFDRSLYVVAADQSLHFRQLFRVLAAMGFSWADRCQHVPFGRVHGMSTRRGNLVFLDEVLDEAVAKARAIGEASNRIKTEYLDDVATAVGVGAVMFGDLRNLRTSDYAFDWEEILNFSGHTGPYVQFSHARACSILERAGGAPKTADLSRLALPEERAVIVALGRYPDAVEEACDAFEPSVVSRTLIEVAQTTASWLTAGTKDRAKRVITEDDADLRNARLALIDAVRNVLAHGLSLLGCQAPEAM